MKLPNGVKRLLRLSEPARDVDEELRFHFDHAVAELRSRGVSAADARREAERRFGDVSVYRRQLVGLDTDAARARRRLAWLDVFRDVTVHAFRSVRRAPWLSCAIVVTFALGLGANLSMYGIVDRLLLSPPDYVAHPEQVRRIMIEKYDSYRGERSTQSHFSYPDFEDLLASQLLEGAAVWQERLLTLGHGLDARQITGVLVSDHYFSVLGAKPALGRLLNADDNLPSAERAIVISYSMWRREFGGTRDVLGKTLDFGSGPWTIVGVAPRGMTTLRLFPADLWQPLRMKSEAMQVLARERGYQAFAAVARIRAGASEAAAAAQLSLLHRRGREEEIGARQYDASARVLLTPLLEARGPKAVPEAKVTKWLAGVSVLVLMIACINVANLLLARVVRQHREIAVRLALGISRSRLLGQILLEGLILGLFGGAAALVIARWAGSAVSAFLLPGFAWDEMISLPRLVPLAVLLSVISGLIAAAVPAMQASRRTLALSLRQAGAGGETTSALRVRSGLALLQAALSVVLLVGAGLFVRSLNAVHDVDLGFDADRLLYVEHTLATGSVKPEERARIATQVLELLSSHPAIEVAGGGNTAPLAWTMTNVVRVPGVDSLPRGGEMLQYEISADYFRVLGTAILTGRAFRSTDRAGSPKVAIISESLARTVWPTQSALGQCMQIGKDRDCTSVVGIVQDMRNHGVGSTETLQYFLPLGQASPRGPAIVMVRPRADIADAASIIRSAVVGIDSRIRFVQVTPAAKRLSAYERSWRLGATLFSAFGALALVIASLGLYAVIAFDVSRRLREIGVRTALGATRSSIMTMVISRALGIATLGIALGLTVAALLAPRVRDLLFEVEPYDPLTYAVVAGSLMLVAVVAGLLPARRAASVDPSIALRAE